MFCRRDGEPRMGTYYVGSAGYLQLFPSQSPESASLRGCPALILWSLHIPHILYAQLRRNNQGSKQDHSRQPCPTPPGSHVQKESSREPGRKTSDQKGKQEEASKHPGPGVPLLATRQKVVKTEHEDSGEKGRRRGEVRDTERQKEGPSCTLLTLLLLHYSHMSLEVS